MSKRVLTPAPRRGIVPGVVTLPSEAAGEDQEHGNAHGTPGEVAGAAICHSQKALGRTEFAGAELGTNQKSAVLC